MTEEPEGPQQSATEPPQARSARELVRKRRKTYAAPDTGRRHHIGAAPEVVPLHTDKGVGVTRTTSWQLADRTPAQLEAQQALTADKMRSAADALDFEEAANLRDELTAVEDEIIRRRNG